MMQLTQKIPVTRTGFKVVCKSCGSLSIKVADLTKLGSEPIVRCGRCDAVRGTLAELHSLARTSTVEFKL